jgi:hypothetical protein
MLSARGKVNADQLSIPWKFALSTTYDPVANPEGLISFATAENVGNMLYPKLANSDEDLGIDAQRARRNCE